MEYIENTRAKNSNSSSSNMRILHVVAVAVVTATFCQAQDKVPSQVRSARSRYDAAVKAAVEPLRLRYLEELNRMRSDAMLQKNLDLANAIDAEITTISVKPGPTQGMFATILVATTWSWGLTAESATSTLRFLENGTYTVNNEPMGKWTVVNSTTVRFENGSLLKFSNDMKSYEATTPSGARAGKKR
jgi:hypothetical protein